MQIIEAYSLSLHLGFGSIVYSQFLIGKKTTLQWEGIALLQRSRFACKKIYLFHLQICYLKCPRNNILKTLSCSGKNTEQEPLGNTDLPRV